jgi:hypothetical protein
MQDGLFSITRIGEELSVVCRDVLVPEGIRAEGAGVPSGLPGSMISPRSASWRAWLSRLPVRA